MIQYLSTTIVYTVYLFKQIQLVIITVTDSDKAIKNKTEYQSLHDRKDPLEPSEIFSYCIYEHILLTVNTHLTMFYSG